MSEEKQRIHDIRRRLGAARRQLNEQDVAIGRLSASVSESEVLDLAKVLDDEMSTPEHRHCLTAMLA